jgi:hypothetical protein
MDEAAGKADDPRCAADMLDPAGDLQLLLSQSLGCKDGVRFGLPFLAHHVHDLHQFLVSDAARAAVSQVLGHRRIRPFALTYRQTGVEQALVGEMPRQ